MTGPQPSLLDKILRFCLENKLVVGLFLLAVTGWGLMVAPFDWEMAGLPRDPVPVDAIPDYGENQQIVFTKWPGRSPQDVEDQVTYPLVSALLGVPAVKSIRATSLFGFSSISVIFKDEAEFYWTRSRLLEKLASLPAGTLPDGVRPALGPDATGLGQVFWYTLEGRDEKGRPTGGWNLRELRSIQDWQVRYALQAVDGVAEVSSVGGFVKEYQVDVDPDSMRAYGVTLEDVARAVRRSNLDVGARTIEVNRVEYVIRGLGFIKTVKDLEETVVKARGGTPVLVRDVGRVVLGPALRRGALDKGGAEAVGGVVVVRYGTNPLAVIKRVKERIAEIAPGLPSKILEDGRLSKVTIVPFYDRTGLIYETLGTLNTALADEILVTIIVVLLMVMHLRSSILISGLLPLAVLICFIAMKQFRIDANVVALSGIAIAIGTMVDMGIVICENILKHLERAGPGEDRKEIVFRASSEVGSAVLTAVLTTVVSFLPVFTMEAAEGKLFKPLAWTKTFALIAAVLVSLTIIPPLAHLIFTRDSARKGKGRVRLLMASLLVLLGVPLFFLAAWWAGAIPAAGGAWLLLSPRIPGGVKKWLQRSANILAALAVALLLSRHWMPLGPEEGIFNFLFTLLFIGGFLGIIFLFQFFYEPILRWCLDHKLLFLALPSLVVLLGFTIWLGAGKVFFFLPDSVKKTEAWTKVVRTFPGLGKEFMPSLDEGSFLYMPTTSPHASIGQALDMLHKQDMAIQAIPEVENVVGKIGRVESPLDPAPISMVETVINYKPEYKVGKDGRPLRFKFDREKGEFVRDRRGRLIPDPSGRYFRNWRPEIKSPKDIWKEIVKAARLPGVTDAPRLQPIETRLVMLQTGMRAPMGVKVFGPDLETIEKVGIQIEAFLKQVPSVNPATVTADRIVGKPYLEYELNREAMARYGLSVEQVQGVIEIAVGGKPLTMTVEGRERYPVRVRYMRELRDRIEDLDKILVPTPGGARIPLAQIAKVVYRRGPQAIKSEDGFLVGYVTFDKKPGFPEVDVVESCKAYLEKMRKDGKFTLPAGVTYRFTGTYENSLRSEKRLKMVLPLALFIILMILYFQFKSLVTTLIVFSGVFVAWSGGFLMLWLYGQDWFLNFHLFGTDMRALFQVHPLNLSVAVWVGFLALFGIATDDGVILATYIKQSLAREKPATKKEVREAVILAGKRRIRPCLMTAGTTILALLPVLTSSGKGSDIMVPMAIPSFGGMTVVLITVFVVPTLYCWVRELKVSRSGK